jgi:hypothetical protein
MNTVQKHNIRTNILSSQTFNYSIVACAFVAAETCLLSRCLAIDVSSGATIRAFGRHITLFYGTPKVDYLVHKSPRLVSFLSQINEVHATPSCLRSVLILSTHLRLELSSGLFPAGFPTKMLYAVLLFPFVLHALPISSSLTSSF